MPTKTNPHDSQSIETVMELWSHGGRGPDTALEVQEAMREEHLIVGPGVAEEPTPTAVTKPTPRVCSVTRASPFHGARVCACGRSSCRPTARSWCALPLPAMGVEHGIAATSAADLVDRVARVHAPCRR